MVELVNLRILGLQLGFKTGDAGVLSGQGLGRLVDVQKVRTVGSEGLSLDGERWRQ